MSPNGCPVRQSGASPLGTRQRSLTLLVAVSIILAMGHQRPSRTAAWVATCRGLGHLLPPGEHLCDDPLGLLFGGHAARRLATLVRYEPDLAWRLILRLRPMALALYWVQLRTRAIDDLLLSFTSSGGRQIVILGAGYDCRATRLVDQLGNAQVFEVDHCATQAHKRQLLREHGTDSVAQYAAHDFERDPLNELPARLADLGHDPGKPTFTLWEGVTMYLTEAAIAATVNAVRAMSAPESQFAFEYYEQASVIRQSGLERALGRVGIQRREPFRFGWSPTELAAWLSQHGFSLQADESEDTIATRYMSAHNTLQFLGLRGNWRFHLALAVVDGADASIRAHP
jgi:methyltransferase (TIGR00027 family)